MLDILQALRKRSVPGSRSAFSQLAKGEPSLFPPLALLFLQPVSPQVVKDDEAPEGRQSQTSHSHLRGTYGWPYRLLSDKKKGHAPLSSNRLFPRFVQPVLSRVIKDEEDPEDALGEAIPDLLQALSMGLPCREMCDTVTRTCGCGDPETFGEVSARSRFLVICHVAFGCWVPIWS
jgi:hypothetical protein